MKMKYLIADRLNTARAGVIISILRGLPLNRLNKEAKVLNRKRLLNNKWTRLISQRALTLEVFTQDANPKI